ncbi:hypothetical protein CMI47_09800 [Candidatus Pacearchaeota archaeon]|nr:hypothetical protein [Candidatus Pacearchaeota archaeon]|tara:strand:+ start:1168 stop:2430 length:1263 start_codon:yes stop_codon:yes gene_type:complete
MKKTIDFITIDYGLIKNTKLLVKSIRKTVNTEKYDYVINIVYQHNGNNIKKRENEIRSILIKECGDGSMINLIEGVNHSDQTVTAETIDGNIVGFGSVYDAMGISKGLKASTKDYVCMVHADSFFMSKNWTDYYVEKADEYFFAAARYDDYSHFKSNRGDKFEKLNPDLKSLGIAWNHFIFAKRKNIIDNNLFPDCSFRDTHGNITLFSYQNDKTFWTFPMFSNLRYRSSCNHEVTIGELDDYLNVDKSVRLFDSNFDVNFNARKYPLDQRIGRVPPKNRLIGESQYLSGKNKLFPLDKIPGDIIGNAGSDNDFINKFYLTLVMYADGDFSLNRTCKKQGLKCSHGSIYRKYNDNEYIKPYKSIYGYSSLWITKLSCGCEVDNDSQYEILWWHQMQGWSKARKMLSIGFYPLANKYLDHL